MKYLPAVVLLATTLPVFASDIACNPAGSQMELNACAGQALAQADAELNEVYRQIMDRHAGQSVALANIKSAQRLWIQLRDADLAARYPLGQDENPRVLYGSMYPMLYANAKTALTRARTSYLRQQFLERGEYDL
ncbi:lysozyme inhibitor LprI family protein [Pseudoxanthomonas dokdonensis]|uniref:Lysozyme inhibitor LprI-like N-terminal domain-containing protein n=1 Tax=Pseudoxanthomonas dokdonensis TaxID=344882 RepID=A0A0R0CQZ8_9GAMM|nr:lysozyme inhibitor LprI family protein [Pseudoxanthomonas dokdonensis]KRG68004.1 hypothetical protein ABB29_14585 [Pseudoxanthomonas dokdonensis]